MPSFLEFHFGHDFGHVRASTDVRVMESTRAVNALAYTVGRNVVFGAGQYAPRKNAGRKLMAHELTHVIQQERGGDTPDLDPGAPHEHNAEAASNAAVSGKSLVSVLGATSVGIARQS